MLCILNILIQEFHKTSSVQQIDLTPTLSLLLGIPIPFSSLGVVILDAFKDLESEAIHANYLQV